MLPFSVEDFFALFADYNESVWPVQWVLMGVAIAVVLAVVTGSESRFRDRIVCAALGVFWVWMAVFYHLVWFTTINTMAYLFAAAFLVQSAAFLWWSFEGLPLDLSYRLDSRTVAGASMLTYALIGYPVLNEVLGHDYPTNPSFGVPCPTTIFTLGLLVLARARRAGLLRIVPLLWSVIGGSAAFLLGVWQDLGLIVSGAIVCVLSVSELRKQSRGSRPEPVD